MRSFSINDLVNLLNMLFLLCSKEKYCYLNLSYTYITIHIHVYLNFLIRKIFHFEVLRRCISIV